MNVVGTAISVILPALGGIVGWLAKSMQKSKAKDNAITNGMAILLRAHLMAIHRDYVETGNPCPISIKDDATEAYEAYHALGHNGTGTQLYNDIMAARVGASTKKD